MGARPTRKIAMPEFHAPGVYVPEVPTDLPIAAAPTSRTAFLGSAGHGPVGRPTIIRSIDEFRSAFGSSGTLPAAVELFFANGGTDAVVVRLQPDTKASAGRAPTARGKAALEKGKISPLTKRLTTETGVPGGGLIDAVCILGEGGGIRALDRAEFDLLYIPPYSASKDVEVEVLSAAAAYCRERRAMLLIDAPRGWSSASEAERGIRDLRHALGNDARNAALYFPHLRRGSGAEGATIDVPPCAAVAGIIARTDARRGCWKAPAGTEAQVKGVQGTVIALTDADFDRLNPLAINSIRSVPGTGVVVWGSRTLEAAGTEGSEWKYIPVRRTALLIEKSLVQGLRWTAFEPNDQALWSRVRSSVEALLLDLFRQGAFQGTAPRDTHFVRCGMDTTSHVEIENGALNLEVGFAPLRPAEFIVLRLRLAAGRGAP